MALGTRDMAATMRRMEKHAAEGKEEAIEFLDFIKGKTNTLSAKAQAFVEETEGIFRTVIDDLNPLTKNVIEMTNVPALLARSFVQVYGAFRPTKQQATALWEAFCKCSEITTPAFRDLVDAGKVSFSASMERWIATLEDDPTSEPKAAAALSDLPPIGKPLPTPDKPLSADKV